jgi:hypothetical protein
MLMLLLTVRVAYRDYRPDDTIAIATIGVDEAWSRTLVALMSREFRDNTQYKGTANTVASLVCLLGRVNNTKLNLVHCLSIAQLKM